MKNLIILFTLLAAICSWQASAQSRMNEVSVYGGGGLSTLKYQPSLDGERIGGFGSDFGLGYTFGFTKERVTGTGRLFHENWGFHTGIGLGVYNTDVKLSGYMEIAEGQTDDEGDQFDLYTTLIEYRESQKAMFLKIPVMAQFQYGQVFVMGGVKLGIPINGKFKTKDATLKNEAWYPEYKNWLTEQEFAGFGTFPGKNFDGDFKLGISVMLALETGLKWRINDNISLYTGVYFDYGLNNSAKKDQKVFLNYDQSNPSEFTTNSILSVSNVKLESVKIDKINIMSAGIRLRLAMDYW